MCMPVATTLEAPSTKDLCSQHTAKSTISGLIRNAVDQKADCGADVLKEWNARLFTPWPMATLIQDEWAAVPEEVARHVALRQLSRVTRPAYRR